MPNLQCLGIVSAVNAAVMNAGVRSGRVVGTDRSELLCHCMYKIMYVYMSYKPAIAMLVFSHLQQISGKESSCTIYQDM